MQSSRPVLSHQVIEARGGMVVAQHPEGARIGLEVLEKGGNAVDAAVTTAFAMGVLQPLMNGIGGGGLVVVRTTDGPRAIDYGMQVPAAAAPDMFELEDHLEPLTAGGHRYARRFAYPAVKNDANIKGHTSITTPGTLAGLAAALERWGTISLADAIAPAADLAEQGFRVGHHFTLMLVAKSDYFLDFPATKEIYYPDGQPIPPGGLLVQKDHANTLRRIAQEGTDVFYRGEIAEMIAGEIEQHGGSMRANDLAEYEPVVHEEPLSGSYRGAGIWAVPGACAGTTVLEILNILESFDVSRLRWGTPDFLHLVIEATKRAAVDRFTYMGDASITGAPVEVLVDKEYARERADTIDMRNATSPEAGDPWPRSGRERPADFPAPDGLSFDAGTTHLTVMDSDHNAVALTQTNVGYSGVVVPGVGVMMNDAMRWPSPLPGTVNSIAPRARSLNNMTPVILHRDGDVVAALGSSGGRRIWTAISQAIVNHLDFGMGLQVAVQAPRLHVESDDILLDGRFGDEVKSALETLGHDIEIATPDHGKAPYSEPNGIQQDRGVLRSAVYPVAKPTFAAGH